MLTNFIIFFLFQKAFNIFLSSQVTDLTLARENQSSFEEYLNSNPLANPGIDLTVTVLTTGFWPSYKSFDLNLPAEMVQTWSFLFLLVSSYGIEVCFNQAQLFFIYMLYIG